MRSQIRVLAVGMAVVALIVGIVASGVTLPKQKAAAAASLSEIQYRLIENYRARHPIFDYRFNDETYSCQYSRGSSFVAGDFNNDGYEDFAVILRVREGPSHLAVFDGPPLSNSQEPAYEADINNLGFFASSPSEPARLYAEVCALGPDASPGFSLVPRGDTYMPEWTLVPGG